jgi:hypothetical protein
MDSFAATAQSETWAAVRGKLAKGNQIASNGNVQGQYLNTNPIERRSQPHEISFSNKTKRKTLFTNSIPFAALRK